MATSGEHLDNIILITPNEGLSAQHMAEMTASGIPSARFGDTGLLAGHRRTVRVTEITKLVEKRTGKGTGVSIEVDALGDRNLVFVDEGHRGASGEAWRTVRDAVAARGFTFEYSATFGQALAAARDTKLIGDYGKSIVFDYSYRYFHRDDTELFLLRNQGRGRGVGFSLEGTGFYPDFILWMISGDRQRVVFVEPHGMVHAKSYEEDEKARLHERLPGLAEGIVRRSGVGGRVSLDCYIVSATSHGELKPKYGDGTWKPEDFARRHILFPDRKKEYIGVLLADVSQSSEPA